MRIVELILVISMFNNILDGVIGDKEVQIQGEKFESANAQRKLEEKTNYVTIILNQDYNFKINNKSIIEKVIINNGETENLEQEIKAKEGDEIQIHFNTSLRDCSNVFEYINEKIKNKIVSVDLSKFDSSNLEKFDEMFMECSSLKSINFLNFNTAKIKSFSRLFYGCSSLKEIDLSNFNTSSVTTMEYLFFECSSLEKVDLSSFDTSSVTKMF